MSAGAPGQTTELPSQKPMLVIAPSVTTPPGAVSSASSNPARPARIP